jgi:hypothetical protein
MGKLLLMFCTVTVLLWGCGNTENNSESDSTDVNVFSEESDGTGTNSGESAGDNTRSFSERENSQEESPSLFSGSYQLIDFSPLKNERQKFAITTDKDTIVTTKSNVNIFIPKNGFRLKNGKKAGQEVEFFVTEYFDYFGLAANNLTTSTKNGHLRSGGMFVLEAYSNNQELELVPHKELVLQLPHDTEKDMKIYYGNRNDKGNMVWECDEFSRQPYPAMVCINGKFCDRTRFFFEDNFCFSKAAMVRLINDTLNFSVSYNNKGVIIGSVVCNKTGNPNKDKACDKFMQLAGLLKDSFPNMVNSSWETQFQFMVMGYDNYANFLEKRRQERELFEANLRDEKANKEMSSFVKTTLREDKKVEKFYRQKPSYFIGQLGPINIDIDLTPPNMPSCDLLVKGNELKKDVKLIIKNKLVFIAPERKSDGDFLFTKLPKNTDVVIIGYYVKNDNIYFASKEIRTDKVNGVRVEDLNYTQLKNLEELKARLNSF